MVDSPFESNAVPIVTLRTLLGASSLESSGLGANQDPAQQKQIDRYNRILEKLQDETAKTGAEVLITVQDPDASLLQSRIAEGRRSRRADSKRSLEMASPAATSRDGSAAYRDPMAPDRAAAGRQCRNLRRHRLMVDCREGGP
jgi:hypothetical protein